MGVCVGHKVELYGKRLNWPTCRQWADTCGPEKPGIRREPRLLEEKGILRGICAGPL